jgi:hypothetical protein
MGSKYSYQWHLRTKSCFEEAIVRERNCAGHKESNRSRDGGGPPGDDNPAPTRWLDALLVFKGIAW